MNYKSTVVYALIIAMLAGMIGCAKDTVSERYTFYRPIFSTSEKVKSDIRSAAPMAVSHPGKIAVKDNYIYLSETGKGVHIIDNTNPRSPQNIAFIQIPGNVDIAIRGNYLYADCYTSLVTVDITDPARAKLSHFINATFPDRYAGLASDSNRIIISWQRIDTVVYKRFSESFDKTLDNTVVLNDVTYSGSVASGGSSTSNSTGGSMARFALLDDRLYTVGIADLKVFNTATPAAPVYIKTVNLNAAVETIFPYKQHLFIGGRSGMYIYNVANKNNPVLQGEFWHVPVCDPVIADGNFAYVTLSTGTFCMGVQNQLDVLDITSLSAPSLIKSYQLTCPKGLSKDGNLLFICDSQEGLKIFDAGNAAAISLIKQLKGFTAFDVIALNKIALVVATDGLYFVDYTNPAQAAVVSKFALSTK